MSKSTLENYFLPLTNILWLSSCLLSIVHVAIYGEVLFLLYAFIIAIFFTILTIFVLSVIRKKSDYAKGYKPLIFILGIYLILVSWFGMNKTFPEYQEIATFKKNQSELPYKLGVQRQGVHWDVADLYLTAPKSIDRVEPRVNHKGTMMMHVLLMGKIRDGLEKNYGDDMFELAEIAFSHGRKFSKQWYERAYMHGRKDALDRYNEKMLIVNHKFQITNKNDTEK